MAKTKRVYKRKARKGRKMRVSRNVPDVASCSVTQWIGQNTRANTMYSLRNIQLADFPRAAKIAAAYQHYKITNVMLEFKPSFDTFAPQVNTGPSGTNLQVPYLIYMIDKSGSIPLAIDSDTLGQMGAKPIRFDDKTIKVQWRPSVLTETYGQINAQSQYKISPWLSTNANALAPGVFIPSQIDHLGLFWKVDRAGILPAQVEEYTYEVRITCEFRFKKPLAQPTGSPGEAVVIDMSNPQVAV